MSTVGNKSAIFHLYFNSLLIEPRQFSKILEMSKTHSQSASWRQTDLHTSWRAKFSDRV